MRTHRRADVSMADYARFLPRARQAALVPATSEFWTWRGHRVRLARLRDAAVPVRILVVHGAGAHADAVWPVVSLMAGRGVDLAAIDLPLYGRTVTASRSTVTYEEWIELLVDLIAAEDDGRPLVLLGASIGGLLAVEAAARSGKVAVTVATCLLDPREGGARAAMTRFGPFALAGMPLLALVKGPIARIPVKISWVANLARMGRGPELGALCARDRRGGGAWVPLGFLASYLRHPHQMARTHAGAVQLMHPELDAWTPIWHSTATLATIPGGSGVTMLRGCGHFPLEEPGLSDLVTALDDVVAGVVSRGD